MSDVRHTFIDALCMSAPSNVWIYSLVDPRSGETRYVGKTNRPKARLREHRQWNRHNPHLISWLSELERAGLEPELILLEDCSPDDWQERERAWELRFREQGARLINLAECGQGCIHAWRKHGLYQTREYRIWLGIRFRCLSPKARQYPLYGGRGITVCPEWSSFEQFLVDMGPAPSVGHGLYRIDKSGPYNRDNCAWVTRDEDLARTPGAGALFLSVEEAAECLGVVYETAREWIADGLIQSRRRGRRWFVTREALDCFVRHRQNRGPLKRNRSYGKEYAGFVSPDGEALSAVFNLTRFCAKHGLNQGHMSQVFLGHERAHKGFTCPAAWARTHPAAD